MLEIGVVLGRAINIHSLLTRQNVNHYVQGLQFFFQKLEALYIYFINLLENTISR